jgi:RNA polymerase sigma-70 factor (ECF subfamily)
MAKRAAVYACFRSKGGRVVALYSATHIPRAMSDASDPAPDVTQLLQQWRAGEEGALDRLMPLVYAELHVIASRHMAREWRASVYQTTALVSEAYVKLVGQREVQWQNRAHFFAIAAQLMRRILVDNARRDLRPKHGAGLVSATLTDAEAFAAEEPPVDRIDALALDAALRRLEVFDPEQARLVELRFFGGLTVEETAVVMEVSASTVKREWAIAKGWLYRELSREPGEA